jgi:hypothetical protein
MEEKIQALIVLLRSDDDEKVEETKIALVALAEESGKRTVYNHLESLKRSEILTVQWEIEEVMEILIPPKTKNTIEEDDDPTKRQLRLSELELVVQHPRYGIALYRSKVDTRWVVMQQDPRTLQTMRQDISAEEAESLLQRLQAPF